MKAVFQEILHVKLTIMKNYILIIFSLVLLSCKTNTPIVQYVKSNENKDTLLILNDKIRSEILITNLKYHTNKLNNDKLVSVEFVDERGVLTIEKIVIDSKNSVDYIRIKQDMSNKMVSLSNELKKQLLFELLNLEINNKIQ
jgi:hypothetical protein